MCSRPGSGPHMVGSDFDWSISTKPVVWPARPPRLLPSVVRQVMSSSCGLCTSRPLLPYKYPALSSTGHRRQEPPSLPCPAHHPDLPSSLPALLPLTPALPHLPHSLPHPPVTSPPPLHLTSVRRAGLRGCVSWRLLSECRNVSRSRRCPQSGGEISARPAGVTLAHGWSV